MAGAAAFVAATDATARNNDNSASTQRGRDIQITAWFGFAHYPAE